MTNEPEVPTDWRGTPITEGALVIYGAPVGRSIALVEAEVVGFTKTGRVNLRILRRKSGGSWSAKEVVHVGADRLTIVAELPPTELPLLGDAIAERKAAQAERTRIFGTHDFPDREVIEDRPGDWWSRRYEPWPPCTKCGADRYPRDAESRSVPLQECPS